MLDAFVADQILPKGDGLRARIGPLSLALECSHRDSEALLAAEDKVVFTVLEIEGERLASAILIGFASERRRDLYLLLRGLKGIGRRSALAVLDTGNSLDILRSVAAKDSSLLSTVPGLGGKRIEAIFETLEVAYEGSLPKPLPLPVALWVEVRDALVHSGVSEEEAEKKIHNSSLQKDAEALIGEIKESDES